MAIGSFFYDNAFACWIYTKKTLQIIEVNKKSLCLYGYTENEFLENLKVCDLVPTKQKAPFRSYLRSKEPGSPAFVQQITKDGKELTVLVLTQNVRLNGVDCAYVIAVEREQIESVNRLQVKQQKRTRQAQTKNSLVQMPL